MRMGKGFEEAMQEMIDYVKHQDLNVKRQFQKELEEVNEFLKSVLQSFEQEDLTLHTQVAKNQERKEFIEEAKRYWSEKGEGLFLAKEFVDNKTVYRLGYKPEPSTNSISVTLIRKDDLPEIPSEYQTNDYLARAFLLSSMLGDNQYSKHKQPPLPTHFAKNMRIGRDKSSAFVNTNDILIKKSAGQRFQKQFILLDDTDVVYE